jgi:hypothetical protein
MISNIQFTLGSVVHLGQPKFCVEGYDLHSSPTHLSMNCTGDNLHFTLADYHGTIVKCYLVISASGKPLNGPSLGSRLHC